MSLQITSLANNYSTSSSNNSVSSSISYSSEPGKTYYRLLFSVSNKGAVLFANASSLNLGTIIIRRGTNTMSLIRGGLISSENSGGNLGSALYTMILDNSTSPTFNHSNLLLGSGADTSYRCIYTYNSINGGMHSFTLSSNSPLSDFFQFNDEIQWQFTAIYKIVSPISLDSNESINIIKNPYNPVKTQTLTVSPTGGNSSYTYSWRNSSNQQIGTGTSQIVSLDASGNYTFSVTVGDSINTAAQTKTFTINYTDPIVTNNFGTAPSGSSFNTTSDGKIFASTATFSNLSSTIGSLNGQVANLGSYVAPSGIASVAGKIVETTDNNGYTTVNFDIDKYNSSGNAVQSSLTNSATFGVINFDVSQNRTFSIAWKDSADNTIKTMASYTHSSGSRQTYYAGITLDLSYNSGGHNYFRYFGPNSETLVVVAPSGVSAIPCFVAGTRILTPTGEKLVENLRTGDLVLTADGRKVPATIYSTKIAETTKENAPYLIPANAFRAHFPPQDITLSPKHAIQSAKGIWEIPQFAEGRFPAVQKTRVGEPVTYYHIELPNFFTDNLVANGSVCESLGAKAQKVLPKGKALYSFSKKLNGFTRYSPEATATKKTK